MRSARVNARPTLASYSRSMVTVFVRARMTTVTTAKTSTRQIPAKNMIGCMGFHSSSGRGTCPGLSLALVSEGPSFRREGSLHAALIQPAGAL